MHCDWCCTLYRKSTARWRGVLWFRRPLLGLFGGKNCEAYGTTKGNKRDRYLYGTPVQHLCTTFQHNEKTVTKPMAANQNEFSTLSSPQVQPGSSSSLSAALEPLSPDQPIEVPHRRGVFPSRQEMMAAMSRMRQIFLSFFAASIIAISSIWSYRIFLGFLGFFLLFLLD